jgi:dienelactone hydrolase
MSWIDLFLAASLFALVAAQAFRGSILTRACWAVLFLGVLQLAIEGLCWQFLPGYALLAAITLYAWWRPHGWVRLLALLGLAVAAICAAAAWIFLPVPRLTEPAGPYALGTQVFRWVDASRPEPATGDPSDQRNVVVQAWYPAAADSVGTQAAYLDGANRLPPFVTVLPRFVFQRYGRIDTQGTLNAAVQHQRKWPVVLFSPGYGAPRAFYTSVVTGLASRGYAVLAIDHPYESAVTELADGRIATTVENFSSDSRGRIRFMEERLEVRAADVRFVLDQLVRPSHALFEHFDLTRVSAMGHSFGGATAAVSMERDQRIMAAANIDGTLYGPIAGKRLPHPFLLLESDHRDTGHSEHYREGNRRLLENSSSRAYRYQILRANHFSFTDVPLFFSPPARLGLALMLGGARGPTETHRATVEILAAFLNGGSGIPAAAAQYRNIVGGTVRP